MSKYSSYSVVVAGGQDSGGAENLCAAAEKQFPGLTAERRDSGEHDPAGIILGSPDGPDPTICKEIQLWLEAKREIFC